MTFDSNWPADCGLVGWRFGSIFGVSGGVYGGGGSVYDDMGVINDKGGCDVFSPLGKTESICNSFKV